MLKIKDNVKIKMDKVLAPYKKYNKVYEIIEIRDTFDGITIYKLKGVPNWGTADMLEKVGDKE